MNRPPDSPPLEVYLLGTVAFDEIQRVQRRLVYELGERGRGGGALVLCEHPPTISVGRSGSRAHILADDHELRSRGVAVRWVNRGGGCVLHLPGQLAGYLAMPLAAGGLDLRRYLDGLQGMLVGVLAEFGLAGSTRPDQPGVFLGDARVATVGVAVSRWIAYQGFTLNVSTFLEPFGVIDEPGPAPSRRAVRQTSMESRRQRPAPMAQVREAVIRQVESAFGLERHHLYTQHPMIRREVGPHAYASSPG